MNGNNCSKKSVINHVEFINEVEKSLIKFKQSHLASKNIVSKLHELMKDEQNS